MWSEIKATMEDLGSYSQLVRRLMARDAGGQGVHGLGGLVGRMVGRYHPERMELRVVGIRDETPSARTFRLQRIDGPLPPFRAGQYVSLVLRGGGLTTSRPYSISSAPGEALLNLTIRRKPGGLMSGYLFDRVDVGDVVATGGPTGAFCYEPLSDGKDLVFLAGGSGITPFMSILRDLWIRGISLKVHLLYGVRSLEDVIFLKDLRALEALFPGFTMSLVVSEPPPAYQGLAGLLDEERLRATVSDPTGKTWYICGPHAMLRLCSGALGRMGVQAHRLRHEAFGPPEDVTREAGWPTGLGADQMFQVKLRGSKALMEARAGEPLLVTLERHGVAMASSCRSGSCSSCRVRLLSGQVFTPRYVHVRESDRHHGYIHSCVSYPLTSLQIQI